ncbi:TetR/AcrR family transcriptional regulator [Spongiibacter sp. KMU-166]|uniref:TetR/AcrR family transcriptional regulator n=1 Tax=Spongiibacter thalassae TaxID=2721624 RepID=A0ABX1GG58_9GAMM|nr:TetR/AcrR family transcriptional regulator [Spongiibacter thalassae]NKI17528.1 TetR/AcrR family transcriptional regulator [Spongiibacter thalassae]
MSSIRQKILDTATDYLREHTLAEAQINELCQLAEVSRTSFYREFKNLDDLFTCVVTQLWTERLRAIISESEQATCPRKRLFHFAKQLASTAQSRDYLPRDEASIGQAIHLLYREDSRAPAAFTDITQPFIATCQRDGGVRQDIPAEEVADWILRQMWVLVSIPLTPKPDAGALGRYLQLFIVDALRPLQDDSTQDDTVHHKLDAILDKLRYL